MKEKLPRLVFYIFLVTTIVSILGRIYVSSELSTKGEEIRSLERDLMNLTRENKELKSLIAQSSSLQRVKDFASSRGMQAASGVEFLSSLTTASYETSDLN